MEKIAILVLVLANFGLQSSDAKVQVPFNEESLTSAISLNVICVVTNETFVGWFKDDTGTKIPQVASRNDVKDLTAVLVEPGAKPGEQRCHLIFPRGSPVSVGGKYTCQGKTNSAKLNIVFKFNLAGLKTSQQLHVSQSGKIILGALSYPLSKITWKKDNKALDFSDARLTLEKDGSIVFTKVLDSDAGSYVAKVNWEDRNIDDHNINVTVVDKPVFTVTPKPAKLTGVEGYDYEFCFDATGLPVPTLKWFKSTVQFDTTNNRYSVNNKCIGIKKLEKSDIAVYKCEASNTAGTDTATVEIEKLGVKPSVVPFPQHLYKRNRLDSFKVLCAGQGTPAPSMEWTKAGKAVNGQKKEPGKSTLEISKVRVEDSGNYTCTANNNLIYKGKELTAALDIQLNVIVKPVINEQRSDSIVYSFVGNRNDVRVRCDFYGEPKPAVIMKKGGVAVKNGTQVVEHFFRTKNIKDFGDYICKAKNVHGEGTYTVKVVQATAPGKPREVSANKTCNSITLNWKPPLSDGNMMIIHYVISSLKDRALLHKNNVDGRKRSVLIEYKFQPHTTYQVEVRARNAAGVSEAQSIDVTTETYCKPGPPAITNLGLTETGPSLLVKWNPPKDNGFDDKLKYRVAWRPKADKPQKWAMSDELSVTEYQINNLNIGKYEIKVFAVSQAGKGSPDMRVVEVISPKDPPVQAKRTGALSKGAIAGIVIAILLIVLITIDLFCCFFNSCGVIFCCQRTCCGKKYEVDGNAKGSEMEKLQKNPPPEHV